MKKQIVGSAKNYLSRVCRGFRFYLKIILALFSSFYLFIYKDINYMSFIMFIILTIALFAHPFLANRNYLYSIAIKGKTFILSTKNIKGRIVSFEYPLSEIKVEIINNYTQRYSNEVLVIYNKNECIKKQSIVCGWDKSKFEKVVKLIYEEKQNLDIPVNTYIKY